MDLAPFTVKAGGRSRARRPDHRSERLALPTTLFAILEPGAHIMACGLDVVCLYNHMKSLRGIAESKRPSLALVVKDLQAKPTAQIKALSPR